MHGLTLKLTTTRYLVAEDSTNWNAIRVVGVRDSAAGHNAAVSTPVVRNAAARAKQLVTGYEKTSLANPVWGAGLRSASIR